MFDTLFQYLSHYTLGATVAHSLELEKKLVNLHYYLVWCQPWLCRVRREGIEVHPSDATNPDEGRFEFSRVMNASLNELIREEQLKESHDREVWSAGSTNPKDAIEKQIGSQLHEGRRKLGKFVSKRPDDNFMHAIFPDLTLMMKSNAADNQRRLEVARLLNCRLTYYLDTLESFLGAPPDGPQNRQYTHLTLGCTNLAVRRCDGSASVNRWRGLTQQALHKRTPHHSI